ncbi:MAG: hypothetical protein WKF30_14770, partial [Pyrinomonadaceae bacterium]
ENLLAERLNRQHTLICAAIRAGRIDGLKQLNEKEKISARKAKQIAQEERIASLTPEHAETSEAPPPPPPPPDVSQAPATVERFVADDQSAQPHSLAAKSEILPSRSTLGPVPQAPAAPVVAAAAAPPVNGASEAKATVEPKSLDTTLLSLALESKVPLGTGALNLDINALNLCLLDEQDLRAGEPAVLCVRVGRGINGADPVENAEVTVKILGTTFQPVIINLKTNQFGMTVARASLPKFNSGRAAILVRAEFDGKEAMLRRVIQRS